MKCTSRIAVLSLAAMLALSLCGCNKEKESKLANPYNIYQNAYNKNTDSKDMVSSFCFMAEELCVGAKENIGTDSVSSEVAKAAGVFNTATGEITYAQNIYDTMYPASTTKILTAYLAIKYGNLEDIVTVSENAVNLADDSSKCGLKAGDKMTLQDLLYGLMIKSGNDAAIAIAEHISGSTDAFAQLMNDEALKMGATGSHFVNPNGLPDENHYTTVYDLYLITQNAAKDAVFRELIGTSSYEVNYTDAGGNAASMEWNATNLYLTGEETLPEGFTVIGGKTGTTGAAGHCLVFLSTNVNQEEIISIVLKADCKSNLYMLMNEIIAGYGN